MKRQVLPCEVTIKIYFSKKLIDKDFGLHKAISGSGDLILPILKWTYQKLNSEVFSIFLICFLKSKLFEFKGYKVILLKYPPKLFYCPQPVFFILKLEASGNLTANLYLGHAPIIQYEGKFFSQYLKMLLSPLLIG